MARPNVKLLLSAFILILLSTSVALGQGTLTITTPQKLLPATTAVPYSLTLSASGGAPPYQNWFIVSGNLPLGLTLNPNTGTIFGQPSAIPGSPNFRVQVSDSNGATAFQDFTLNVYASAGSVLRTSVLSQVAAGGGWATTIVLVNSSNATGGAQIQFHSDSGGPQNFATSSVEQGFTINSSDAVLNYTLLPNSSVQIQTTASPNSPLQQGWADVLGTPGVAGFAIFRQTQLSGAVSEGTTGGQGNFQSVVVLPYDNAAGFVTGVGVVNLSNVPTTVTATIADQDGNTLNTQSFNLPVTGHTAFQAPLQFPVTAGKRGIIQFSSSSNALLAVIGLRFSPSLTFTSIPSILPPSTPQ